MWPHSMHDAWLLALPTLVPYLVLMSLKMAERQTPFTSETFLPEYDYIVGKCARARGRTWAQFNSGRRAQNARGWSPPT